MHFLFQFTPILLRLKWNNLILLRTGGYPPPHPDCRHVCLKYIFKLTASLIKLIQLLVPLLRDKFCIHQKVMTKKVTSKYCDYLSLFVKFSRKKQNMNSIRLWLFTCMRGV